MKSILSIATLIAWNLTTGVSVVAQPAVAKKIATDVKSEGHLSSSILLWMRTDKPRQAGMDRWKGPHAKIIAATKGLEEYRQLHLAENNPGLWPTINGVETTIPTGRKIDGVADVTFKSIFSPGEGKKQTRLAYKDEINLFKRTILYAALGSSSRWYDLAQPKANSDAGSIVFLRMKDGVNEADFKAFINDELAPSLANMHVLSELRSKAYLPWKEKQWNTPNVLHDNPKEVQFQGSLMLGFASKKEMDAFFKSDGVRKLADRLAVFCSAVHAYELTEAITFVENGKIIR